MAGKNKKKGAVKKTKVQQPRPKQVKKQKAKSQRQRGVPAGPVSNVGFESVGGRIGSTLGGIAGSVLGRISGMGAYRVRKNSITNGNPPVFGNGEVTLARREYIGDVSSVGAAFNLTSFEINPGLAASFPWLSQIAANYQQYEFLGLVFEFCQRSATAIASTNTALGSVILATDYNTIDTNFTNKQQMEAYEFACSGCPDQNIIHPVECDPKMNTLSELYVRTGAVPGGTDERFYDIGNFQIATVGQQASSNIGELWVSYHIRLFKPKVATPIGAQVLDAHATGTAATAAVPFANATVKGTSNIPGFAVTNTTICLPVPGSWLVVMNWYTANNNMAGYPNPVSSYGSNLTGDNLSAAGIAASSTGAYWSSFTSNQSLAMVMVNVSTAGTGAANLLTVVGPTSLTGGVWDVFATQLSSGLTSLIKKTPFEVLMEKVSLLEERLSSAYICEEEKESPARCENGRIIVNPPTWVTVKRS